MNTVKKISSWLAAGTFVVQAAAMAPPPREAELNMLVLPARYSVLQVGFDMARRFPTVLVSYRPVPGDEQPLLHAWDGEAWIPLSFEDFSTAGFLRRIPGRAVLVGGDELLPPSLAEAVSWCPRIVNVPEVRTDELLNSLSRVYNFSDSDWHWLAGRYGLQLVDRNIGERRRSWYDDPFLGDYDGELSERLREIRAREVGGERLPPPGEEVEGPAGRRPEPVIMPPSEPLPGDENGTADPAADSAPEDPAAVEDAEPAGGPRQPGDDTGRREVEPDA